MPFINKFGQFVRRYRESHLLFLFKKVSYFDEEYLFLRHPVALFWTFLTPIFVYKFLQSHAQNNTEVFWGFIYVNIRRMTDGNSPQTLLTQDVIWTLIQRYLNVMDVRWTLKKRVLTGKKLTDQYRSCYYQR